MKRYVINVDGEYVKSFRMNREGKLTIYYAKENESMIAVSDEKFANNIARLLGGEVQEAVRYR